MYAYSVTNTLWVLFGTVLIFFMQAGFALLESGFTRAKNAGNIVMKNIVDFCIAAPVFGLAGFWIMYGGSDVVRVQNGVLANGIPFYVFVVFQMCFCGTSATIVSGAMAERTRFSAYCVSSAIVSLLVYPLCGRLIWGQGFLYQLGYHDFAGGSVVHIVGGTTALAGAYVLGPRIGKYTKEGKSRAIPGHNLTLAALGMFILWFGWFGFNGASTQGIDSLELGIKAGRIFVVTTLAAALSALSAMIYTWIRYKKPDVSVTINGAVAGLVSVTAGCDVLTPVGAAITGICAGAFMALTNELIDKKLHVDDPVGAIGVHGAGGLLGILMTGLLSQENGLFYGGGIRPFLIQILGAVCVMAISGLLMLAAFKIIQNTMGLRVPTKEEIAGLDKLEHGLASAYDGFLSVNDSHGYMPTENKAYDNSTILEAQLKTSEDPTISDTAITKVEIIMKQSKFEELKQELNKIGITGITVAQVMGCGMQKGSEEYYRGSSIEMQLLPKIKVEVVVAKVPVKEVVDTAKRVLYTGHVGDGKIFIYKVSNVIKVRTGEEGYDAMQNDD